MSVWESIGMFYVIFATGIATALLLICAGVGANIIYRTYKQGSEKDSFERIVRQ